MKIILSCKPEFSSATKTSVFIKNTKNNHSLTSDWWEYKKYCFKENAKIFSRNSTTQDLVLKRMLELFLTFLPLKKILQFQESILCIFFLNTKNTKNKKQPLEHMPAAETANLVLKRMLELFLKVPPLKKLEVQNSKRDYEICPKSNQKLNQ